MDMIYKTKYQQKKKGGGGGEDPLPIVDILMIRLQLNNWLSEWVTGWPTTWQTDRQTDRQTDELQRSIPHPCSEQTTAETTRKCAEDNSTCKVVQCYPLFVHSPERITDRTSPDKIEHHLIRSKTELLFLMNSLETARKMSGDHCLSAITQLVGSGIIVRSFL